MNNYNEYAKKTKLYKLQNLVLKDKLLRCYFKYILNISIYDIYMYTY